MLNLHVGRVKQAAILCVTEYSWADLSTHAGMRGKEGGCTRLGFCIVVCIARTGYHPTGCASYTQRTLGAGCLCPIDGDVAFSLFFYLAVTGNLDGESLCLWLRQCGA